MPTEVSKGLPIAEVFSSIQGEGTWVGTPMRFIRLAGCPVGKTASQKWEDIPEHKQTRESTGYPTLPILGEGPFRIKGSMCQTWDGRFFPCDTDFSCHTYKTVDELIGETWEKHICLTGGEPLIHQKALTEQGLFAEAFKKGIMIHIETSGTIMINGIFHHDKRVWITISPKWDCKKEMLELADEIKLLIDEGWDELEWEKLSGPVVTHTTNIFVSPINGEKEVNQENVGLALAVLRYHPTWRLSCQWHKFLNLR